MTHDDINQSKPLAPRQGRDKLESPAWSKGAPYASISVLGGNERPVLPNLLIFQGKPQILMFISNLLILNASN